MRVAPDCFCQIDVHLIGQCGDPRQDVGEFMDLLFWRSFAYRLCQFADLFGQPGHAGGDATVSVAVAVGSLDDVLQLCQGHVVTVGDLSSTAPSHVMVGGDA